MLFNSYSYEILYEKFHWIYLQGDIKLLLVTINNRLKFEIEIVHDLSCHPIYGISDVTCNISSCPWAAALSWQRCAYLGRGNLPGDFWGISFQILMQNYRCLRVAVGIPWLTLRHADTDSFIFYIHMNCTVSVMATHCWVLCLVSWAAALGVWTLRAPTSNLTYLLTSE